MSLRRASRLGIVFGIFAFVCIVNLCLAVPVDSTSRSPDTTRIPDGVDLQGHRGARGLAPENTLPAFRRALEIGVTTLEMDVVLSADGRVVVSHEPWMSHVICTAPSGEPISPDEERTHNLYRMTYAEIEQYDCGQRQHPDFPKQKTEPAAKPLLQDVIAMAEAYTAEHDRPPVFYNVEIKSRPAWDGQFHPKPPAFVRRVLEQIHELDVAARTTIQSFDARALREARQLRARREGDTAVRIALLVGQSGDEGLPQNLEALGFLPAVYSPNHHLVDETLVQAAHDRGLAVVPWTVNERSEMERLLGLDVDGLITDYPDVGMEVLKVGGGPPD